MKIELVLYLDGDTPLHEEMKGSSVISVESDEELHAALREEAREYAEERFGNSDWDSDEFRTVVIDAVDSWGAIRRKFAIPVAADVSIDFTAGDIDEREVT